jgi:hypothetical protein
VRGLTGQNYSPQLVLLRRGTGRAVLVYPKDPEVATNCNGRIKGASVLPRIGQNNSNKNTITVCISINYIMFLLAGWNPCKRREG